MIVMSWTDGGFVKRMKVLSTVVIVLSVIAIGVYIYLPLSIDISHKNTKREVSCDVLPFSPESFFKKYMFPLHVDAFAKAYGKPADTFVDQNEGCPIGQLHKWHLKDRNVELLVLGDDYDSQINYDAGCRLYAVRKGNSKTATKFDGVWGIQLGDSDMTVNAKLEKLIQNDPSIKLTRDSNGSAVHCHVIGGGMKHQYVLSKGNVFLYFMVGENGNLETIMFATFDVRTAC